jgi:hypothetical protein
VLTRRYANSPLSYVTRDAGAMRAVSHLRVGDFKGIGPATFMLVVAAGALVLRVLTCNKASQAKHHAGFFLHSATKSQWMTMNGKLRKG